MAACLCSTPPLEPAVGKEGIPQEVGSCHGSVRLPSSHKLKADGGSLKCSRGEGRGRVGSSATSLDWGRGCVCGSGSLPQSQVTSMFQLSGQSGFVPCSLRKAALCVVGPITGSNELFTYVTMYEDARQDLIPTLTIQSDASRGRTCFSRDPGPGSGRNLPQHKRLSNPYD